MWLKAVPPFFAHEPRALALLGADPVSRDVVPELAAAGECVSLMRDVPGADLYEAGRPDLDRMIDALVALQVRWVGAVDALLAAGLPDRRRAGLLAAIEGVAGRADVRARLDDGEVRALDALVDGLPARLDAVGECGLPDTLVHADFHPGNWRGEPGGRLTLLDWGDCVVGNPITDQEAFLLMVSRLRGEDEAAALRAPWSAAWKDAVPGCDPDRAAALLAPVTALERAAIFQGFLDGLEVAEHPYHAHDPEDCLRQAISRQ
jgi:Ser/Thr protein kinase RdoA (MazF antagonist)